MKPYLILLLVLPLLEGCTNNTEEKAFPEPKTNISPKYNTISIDTLLLSDTTSSYQGYTSVQNNKIYFMDAYFSHTYEFDTKGTLLKKHLGAGESKKELQVGHSCAASVFPDGRNIYGGHQIDLHLFDSNFEQIKIFQIQRYLDDSWDHKPLPENPKYYGFQWEKIIIRNFENNVFINISCRQSDINFSSVDTPLEYYKKAKILMKINIDNECITDLLGGYPPSYINHSDKRSQIQNISYDIDKRGNFYISYDADPTIYVYDKNFKAHKAFGCNGREMDTNYVDNYTIKQNEDLFLQNAKARYDYIEYIDETNLLFRSYFKGEQASNAGLQIYKGNTLIADVDVPKGLRIAGYIAPYYYSHIYPDAENKTLKIYRFKLE